MINNEETYSHEIIQPPAPSSSESVHETLLKLRPQLEEVRLKIKAIPTQAMLSGVFFDEFSDEKRSVDEIQRIIAEVMHLKMVVSTEIVSITKASAEVMATISLLSSKGYLPFISRSGSTQKVASNLPFANKHLQAAETLAVMKVLGAIGLLSKDLIDSQDDDLDDLGSVGGVQNDKVKTVVEPEVDNTELAAIIPKQTASKRRLSAAEVKAKAKTIDAEQVKADKAEAEQAKAEQIKADKAEQIKAEQIKADKAKAEQAKADKAKAEQIKADKAKAEQIKADKAEQAKADKAEQAKADKAEQAKAEQAKADKAEQAKADKAKAEQIKADKAEQAKADKAKAEQIKADKAEQAKADKLKSGADAKVSTPKKKARRSGRRAALSAIINDEHEPVPSKKPLEKASEEKVEKAPEPEKKSKAKSRAKVVSKSSDPTKLKEPLVGEASLEKEEITVQSRIAGTLTTESKLTRIEMVDGIRVVADKIDMPVSIIIADALKRDDAVQFDDASDEEVAYIYNKYVVNMGEK